MIRGNKPEADEREACREGSSSTCAVTLQALERATGFPRFAPARGPRLIESRPTEPRISVYTPKNPESLGENVPVNAAAPIVYRSMDIDDRTWVFIPR